MKTKKILSILILSFIILIMLGNTVVNAAEANISATSNNAKVGDTVTINVSFTGASWDIVVSGKGISQGIYAGYTEDLSEKTTTKSFNLNTSTAGVYIITLTGTVTNADGVVTKINKSTTVTISEPEKPVTPVTPTEPENPTKPDVPATTTKSDNANLKDLKTSPVDFTGFKTNVTSGYSVTVENNVDRITVKATKENSKASVSLLNKTNADTGKSWVYLKEGNNEINVIVTAEDGKTQKTYTINVTRKAKEDTTVGKTETPEENNQNNDKISEEKPPVEQNPNETIGQKIGLSSLIIKDLNLSPKFNTNTYEYTIGLREDLSELDIEAEANDPKATIEIIGNEDLKSGENIITILVASAEEKESATYQIIVNKNVINNAEKEETTKWLKPSTWRKEQKLMAAIVVALVLLIAIAIVIKIKMGTEEDDEVDFPGAEELDKALAEHQELTEDIGTEHQIEDDEMYVEEDEEELRRPAKRRSKHSK